MPAIADERPVVFDLRPIDRGDEFLRHKTTRPLLRTDDPYATLKEIFEARTPIYAKADLAVEANASFSIEQMATRVVAALAEAGLLKEPSR